MRGCATKRLCGRLWGRKSKSLSQLNIVGESFDFAQEVFDGNVSVPERALQGVAVHFAMKGEHDAAAVGMFEFDMTAAAVDLHEAQPLQRCQHLPAGQQWELHANSTTSCRSSATS